MKIWFLFYVNIAATYGFSIGFPIQIPIGLLDRFDEIAYRFLVRQDIFLRKLRITKESPPDSLLSTVEIGKNNGYKIEEHFVTTEDGYILTMHRIPHGKNQTTPNKKVIFLMHGILCSSSNWVINRPIAPAFFLADQGYDVWMGNSRGNIYSRNHTTLDPILDYKKFWDFSWHEIGIYDVPSSIDYVLEHTKQKKLFHIGHSQGSTTFYVLLSEKPQYNEKFFGHVSLAPIGYMKHVKGWPQRIASYVFEPFSGLILNLGIVNEFLPISFRLTSTFLATGCSTLNPIGGGICKTIADAIVGRQQVEISQSVNMVFIAQCFAGSSLKQLFHYAQEIISGRFAQYDYKRNNINKYGTLKPPDYNLKNIKVPVYFMYSFNDFFSSDRDVDKLCAEIDTCEKFLNNEKGQYNHLDYLLSTDAQTIVFPRVLELIKKDIK